MAGGPSGAPRASLSGGSHACMTTARTASKAGTRTARMMMGRPRGLIWLLASAPPRVSRAASRLPGSRPAPDMAARVV